MQTADVVIVGGGIVGSSIAYHLAASGCRNILVIEPASAQGKGSTGKSTGGVGARFSTPVSIQMSLYSIPFYAKFEENLGYPCGDRPQGYLFCATSDKQMAYLRTNYTLQVKMGLKDVRLLAAPEIRNMFRSCAQTTCRGEVSVRPTASSTLTAPMIGFVTCAANRFAEGRLIHDTAVL